MGESQDKVSYSEIGIEQAKVSLPS
jgi:hypothetical protein